MLPCFPFRLFCCPWTYMKKKKLSASRQDSELDDVKAQGNDTNII